jgi:SAM-dependent methyltransferase
MISRQLKELFYWTMNYPMQANAWIYRRFRAPQAGVVKVHLGPGRRNYLEGWINVDANFISARIDVWANFARSLPFRSGTVDVFYSHHVIEHLPDNLLGAHFKEMYRCLKPGGGFRIGGPHGESAAKKLIEGDASWFSDFPEKRRSVGGRFANFILCRGEHLTILTPSYVQEVAEDAGFVDVHVRRAGFETGLQEFIDASVFNREDRDQCAVPHTLVIEARKPVASLS